MPRHLLLIRHSQSKPRTGVRPDEFQLTEIGRERAAAFAETVRPWAPTVILSSAEPKAAKTGEIIAGVLEVPVKTLPGLEEHKRGIVESLADQSTFESAIARIFDFPDEIVYGEESGAEALARFSAAVDRALAEHPEGNIALATHGTVIALFVAAHNLIDVKAFWRRLQMPDLTVLKVPGFQWVA